MSLPDRAIQRARCELALAETGRLTHLDERELVVGFGVWRAQPSQLPARLEAPGQATRARAREPRRRS
jgi:hypothetical protein